MGKDAQKVSRMTADLGNMAKLKVTLCLAYPYEEYWFSLTNP